jgi:hypothetical protein
MSIQVTPIPRLTVLTSPAFTFGTANAAGSADSAIASNSTLLAFDTTVPADVGATAATGDTSTAARRNHVHGPIAVGLLTTVTNETRAGAAASGDVSYTGAGFSPNGALIFGHNSEGDDEIFWGLFDDAASDFVLQFKDTTGTHDMEIVPNRLASATDGAASQVGVLKSVDADGITMTWSKVGSGTACAFMIYYFGSP